MVRAPPAKVMGSRSMKQQREFGIPFAHRRRALTLRARLLDLSREVTHRPVFDQPWPAGFCRNDGGG
jgi:hypothetical protein